MMDNEFWHGLQVALGQIEQLAVRRSVPGNVSSAPVVRLALTPSFARFYALPRLSLWEQPASDKPADLRIEIIADLKHANLLEGEVDLAIRYGRGGWKQGSEAGLFEDDLCPVISPRLFSESLASPSKNAVATILQLPLLHAGDSSNWRHWSAAHSLQFKAKNADRILHDYQMTLEAARCGLGVALWSQRLHGLEMFGNDLMPLKFLSAKGELAYYLITRTNAASARQQF